MVYLMESYIKTVTLVCVWRFGKEIAEEEREYRDLSVGLDGYMKVYDTMIMGGWRSHIQWGSCNCSYVNWVFVGLWGESYWEFEWDNVCLKKEDEWRECGEWFEELFEFRFGDVEEGYKDFVYFRYQSLFHYLLNLSYLFLHLQHHYKHLYNNRVHVFHKKTRARIEKTPLIKMWTCFCKIEMCFPR